MKFCIFILILNISFVILVSLNRYKNQLQAKHDIAEIAGSLHIKCNILIVFDTFKEAYDFSRISPSVTITILKSWKFRGKTHHKDPRFIRKEIRTVKPAGHICTFTIIYVDEQPKTSERIYDGSLNTYRALFKTLRSATWILTSSGNNAKVLWKSEHAPNTFLYYMCIMAKKDVNSKSLVVAFNWRAQYGLVLRLLSDADQMLYLVCTHCTTSRLIPLNGAVGEEEDGIVYTIITATIQYKRNHTKNVALTDSIAYAQIITFQNSCASRHSCDCSTAFLQDTTSLEHLSYPDYILSLLICYTNSTVMIGVKDNDVRVSVNIKSNRIYDSWDELPNGIVFIEYPAFAFFSCYADPQLSFEAYTAPFQKWLWIAIVLSLFALLMFFSLILVLDQGFGEIREKLIPTLLLLISFIFEESCDIPKYLNKLRWIVGIWMLLSVIFTNCYVSIAIMRITSPLPLNIAEKFDDLLHPICTLANCPKWMVKAFSIRELQIKKLQKSWNPKFADTFMKEEDEVINATNNLRDYRAQYKILSSNGMDFEFYSGIYHNVEDCYTTFGKFMCEATHRIHWNYEHRRSRFNSKENWTLTNSTLGWTSRLLLNMMLPQRIFWPDDVTNRTLPQTPPFLHYAPDSDVWDDLAETRMTECDRKFAYVDNSETVDKTLAHLEKFYYWLTFKKGKDLVSTDFMTIWTFDSRRRTKLMETLIQMLESGMYAKLKSALFSKVTKRRMEFTMNMTKARNYERFNPVNIAGSIQTVFILWGGLIVVGVCVHIYVDLWEKIIRFVKLIRAMVVYFVVYLLKSIIRCRCLFK